MYSIERLHLNAPALSEDDDDDSELPPSFSMGGEDLFISGKGGVQVSRTGRKDGRVLRDAVIQGNFETARRAYDVVLADLEAEIKGTFDFLIAALRRQALNVLVPAADPTFWGYHISHSGVFVPTSPDAFILHLIGGNGKDLDKIMPPSLQHAVQVHSQLSYLDFFAFLGRVDVVLPSFTEGGKVRSSSRPSEAWRSSDPPCLVLCLSTASRKLPARSPWPLSAASLCSRPNASETPTPT